MSFTPLSIDGVTHRILAGSILKGVGSVGLSLIFWVIGFAFAGGKQVVQLRFLIKAIPSASLSVYLEYASYFPHRSGAEVAYLEKVDLSFHLHEAPPRHSGSPDDSLGIP